MKTSSDYFTDNYSLKDFMLDHGIIPIGAHQHIAETFSRAGATVFFVENSIGSIWTVKVARTGRFDFESLATAAFVRTFLADAGIRVRREEPFLVRKGQRMQIIFVHLTQDCYERITFARIREGRVVPCFKRFRPQLTHETQRHRSI